MSTYTIVKLLSYSADASCAELHRAGCAAIGRARGVDYALTLSAATPEGAALEWAEDTGVDDCDALADEVKIHACCHRS